tara:strand:- start:39 stop:320 length:282 start_codon:yes stop_codon:yes gene_type:complete
MVGDEAFTGLMIVHCTECEWERHDMSDEIVYVSKVMVDRVKGKGKLKRVFVPGDDGPVLMGVHSEVAEFYGETDDSNEPCAATLDYVVGAAAG